MMIGSEVWIGSGFACLNPGVEKEGRLVDATAKGNMSPVLS